MDEHFFQVSLAVSAEETYQSQRRGLPWAPRTDVFEVSSGLVIRAELAGVVADSIDLHYFPDTNKLVLKGRRDDELGTRAVGWQQLEIPDGEFLREIELPRLPIEASGIKAQLRNGMMVIFIPKVKTT